MQKRDDTAKKTSVFSAKLLIYSILGLSVSILLSLIGAVLVNAEKLSPSLIPILAYIFIFLGVFIAGFLSARKFGKALIYSLVQCAVCFLIVYILGAVLFGRIVPNDNIWQVFVSCLGGSLLGGVVSTFSVPKKKRKAFKLDK